MGSSDDRFIHSVNESGTPETTTAMNSTLNMNWTLFYDFFLFVYSQHKVHIRMKIAIDEEEEMNCVRTATSAASLSFVILLWF